MQTDPFFTDGRSAVLNPVVTCLNNSASYGYISDTIDREAIAKEHADPDGSPLGSDTREGFEKGAISIQCNLANADIARPGHIIKLQIGAGDEYYIAQKFGRARQRGEIVKGSLAVIKAYNPILTNLLSLEYGQRIALTQAAGALTGALAAAVTVVNTRAGSTIAYTVAAANGSTLPGWITCNPSTGALSGTAVAGSWELDIICTETLAGQETRVGFGRIGMTIT